MYEMGMFLLLPQSLHFCLFQLVLIGGGAQNALLVAVAAPIVVGVVSVIALVAVTGEEREEG